MKISRKVLVVFLFLGGLLGCKETDDAVSPENGNVGGATEVGVPDGTVSSKVIGAAGGTITSADDRVVLTIPAGALPKDTEISIQPITNKAPNGMGAAYRFSPDGTTFEKPASLTFNYDPRTVAANNPDAFRIATQGADKRWYHMPEVSVDTNAHAITTEMPHFSDWTAYELAVIGSTFIDGAHYVELGASVSLEMWIFNRPIVFGNWDGKPADVEVETVEWKVAGGAANGTVKAGGSIEDMHGEVHKAAFTAPSKNPPSNPVTVIADITLKGKKGKLQVVKQILIGKDYFRGVFAGTPFDWENLTFMVTGKNIVLAGYNENPAQSLHVQINDVNFNAPNRTYAYAERADRSAWAEFTNSYNGPGGGWLSAHADCPSGVRISPGGVTITQISVVDGAEYIQGHLTGPFYMRTEGCPQALRTSSIQAEFRIKNTFKTGLKAAGMANFKGM
ncbi:hypothetical protein SAMN04487996_102329 [Dyadobacter soli]|uniref:ZU5 domain-containing protein n=1 Tax=Dyadobacter soli TaxID=659014 RepID=A0A1G6Y2B2_9BACT|nr:hypothetical protein [Dyadobacter soli]SDD84539.1 hypothetical protein SAMN04487996_102329 [Dyadobacter soli]